MILMTDGSLMKIESIAEFSYGSILQYFWPAFWSSFWVAAEDRFYCSHVLMLSLISFPC